MDHRRRTIEIPDNDSEALIIRGGIEVAFNRGGGLTVYTNGDVKVRPAVNDDAKPRAKTAPEIGDTMEDGAIFAGISPDTGRRMYTRPADAPLTMKWREAMNYAANLDAHGHKDWRLPSKDELDVLYQNRNKGALKGTFRTVNRGSGFARWYWSCTKHPDNSSSVYNVNFTVGGGGWDVKDNYDLSVRCVRR
jgi:hypothetical protein